jgi:hypothetical protein
MKTRIRNIAATFIAVFAGSWSNMGVLKLGANILPAPDGVDINNIESIKSNIHLYQPIDFLFPFLAHALGTFIAVVVFMLLAKTQYAFRYALAFASLFFIGGLSMVMLLPAPMWFNITDLLLAYFPMALLAYWLMNKKGIERV